MTTTIYTISEITREIKLLLEDTLPTIWVQGEVSNFKHHYSGHYYFTLKDASAQLSAVMWSSRVRLLNFDLQDGDQVQALGNIRVYEKTGRYQIDIIRMQPTGVGDLQQAFERLKATLQQEGLFNQEHKKALPAYPQCIGVVTSETGAAIRDIINIISRRAPSVQLIIRPVKVQGEGASDEIARAISEFNEYGLVDLIIVGRGGGSLEDLWAFNEENVARAIYSSKLPVISAVGHEIDFTISDFVADMRAPTPSAAAEIAVPDYREIKSDLFETFKRLKFLTENKIKTLRDRIESINRSYGFRRPEDLVRQYAQQLDDLNARFKTYMVHHQQRLSEKVNHLSHRLHSLSPKNVLQRGYSITYYQNSIIKDVDQLSPGTNIKTELAKGILMSRVVSANEENEDE